MKLQKLQPIFSVILGLALGLLVTMIAGEKPWNVFKILCNGAFGSITPHWYLFPRQLVKYLKFR